MNTVWYVAQNISRRTAPNGWANQGWINAHFVNDGLGPNQHDSRVPSCGSDAPPGGGGDGGPAPTARGCYDGLKWSSHTLTYAYPGAHRYLGNAYQAVANWNAANVGVKIVPVARGQRPDIQFTDIYDARNAGILGTTIIPNHGKGSPTLPTKPLAVGRPIIILLNQPAMDSNKFRSEKEKDFGRTYAATHELGHALGLAHPGDCGMGDVDSIMLDGTPAFFTNPPKFNTPREFDRNEAKMLFAF